MNDEQLKKALERCLSDSPPCAACKYDGDTFTVDECMGKLMKDALDLINRQKAEIEHFREVTKKIKSDLKYYLDTNEENGVVWIPKFTVDNLVKELTEVSDNA